MSTCKICSSPNNKFVLNWGTYKILKCETCKVLYSDPFPTEQELEEFYQGFMFNKPESYELKKNLASKRKELAVLFDLSEISANEQRPKFLDLGGGTGVSVKAFEQYYGDAYYFDLDKQAQEFVNNVLGIRNDRIIIDIENSSLKFEYVLSDNVIEHVTDPQGFVKSLISHADSGGTIVIKTPHGRNTEFYFNPYLLLGAYFKKSLKFNSFMEGVKGLFRRYWHCDPQRHLYSFSRKSLDVLADSCKDQIASHKISYYSIPLFTNTLTKTFFTRDKKASFVRSVLFRLIILPFIPVEVVLQLLKELLLAIGVVSPGGIILTLRKK